MGQQGYTQGDLGWSELTTTSATEALKFYADLAGWESKGEPMPGYHIFGRGDEMLGGISDAVSPDGTKKPTGWMPYIMVDDIDAAIAKV